MFPESVDELALFQLFIFSNFLATIGVLQRVGKAAIYRGFDKPQCPQWQSETNLKQFQHEVEHEPF